MKLKFTLPLFMLIAGLVTSCDSDLSEPNLENIPQESNLFIPVDETDEASIFPLKTAFYSEYGILGHGYDITKDYAIEDGISNKGQVIDIQKIRNDENLPSDIIHVGSPLLQKGYSWSASNAAEYCYELTKKTGLDLPVPVFGGAIRSGFGNGRNANKEFDGKLIYGTFEGNVLLKSARIVGLVDIEDRKNYLSEDFASFIESNNGQQIVKNFGTHVIVNALFGVKYQLNYQAETDMPDRRERAGPLNYSNEESENYNEVFMWRTIGGDTSLALSGRHSKADGTPPPQLSFGNWQSKTTEENIVLIDFAPGSLVPIYDFIPDPIKRAEVKIYLDKYISDNSVKLFDQKTNIHRLRDQKGTNHLFTAEPENELLKGFEYEGVSFQAYSYHVPGTKPVRRFYNPDSEDHMFSFIYFDGNYEFEKIAFYAFESEAPGTKPIFSSNKKRGKKINRLLTSDYQEHQNALKNGYTDDGIAFYAY